MPSPSLARTLASVLLLAVHLLGMGAQVGRGIACPHGGSGGMAHGDVAEMGHAGHGTMDSAATSADETHDHQAPSPCRCGADCPLCPPSPGPVVETRGITFDVAARPLAVRAAGHVETPTTRDRYLQPPAHAPPLLA